VDSRFIDLDILLTRIREPRSKAYFLDAVKAYKAGALRAALSSAWVAVVYDLISKYRELAALSDAAAVTFLKIWDAATANNDVRKLLELEATIVSDATANTQLINRFAETQLLRMREDRHLCAHPAFSTEAQLFEPSPEMVRLHLVNAIELVLSQEPLQGKTIFEQFDLDVQSPGFPSAGFKVHEYVEQRYLARIRPQTVRNFGIVLAKSLLKGVPLQWRNQRQKIVQSLVAARERAPATWPEISDAITRLIDGLEPPNRVHAIAFLAEFPDFWPALNGSTKTALQETIANIDAIQLTDYHLLAAVRLPQFRQELLKVITVLTREQLRDALAIEALPELWPRALEFYSNSASFRSSESNFRDYIVPYSNMLPSSCHDALLAAIMDNGQNWAAAQTPQLLLGMLENSRIADFPTHHARDQFYNFLREHHHVKHYADVFGGPLRMGGWVASEAAPANEEEK
jgi:hypothetical protein